MPYTETQLTHMRILHGMLESDPINSFEEFRKVFTCLHEGCNIPWATVQKILNKPPWLMEEWSNGRNLPKEKDWHTIRRMVMCVLEKEVGS